MLIDAQIRFNQASFCRSVHPESLRSFFAMVCSFLLLPPLTLICFTPSIRYLYRRNKKGITAKLDDDLLKFYCNEDTFLMQVRHSLII